MSLKYTPPRKKRFRGDKKNVSFRFPEDLVEFYGERAEELGISVTELIIDVLDQVAVEIEESSSSKRKT